ncbi:glycosyltransferase [Marinobacterium sp. AK62]|uniref:Glycosyltransferase n=1 Tax=Marinobacterium alkalitolerans TaxID=1542925 RepID=A0ABS3ZDD6_9GAMM|nr:glycosyltransferase [Marinobacterium alkalitolerans]MBP0049718.1 glycosyltransferase [Marinobacterium alkalitolerans]
MRIVIDMQGAQSSGSRHRGIGRYTLSFVAALVEAARDHEVLLVLNGQYPDTLKDIRDAFAQRLPASAIKVWFAAEPLGRYQPRGRELREQAKSIREAFISQLAPDLVLVTSLFEGHQDEVVVSVGHFRNIPTAVLLYDLIPLIYEERYLADPSVRSWYLEQLDYLKSADLLLAISESSRQEALQLLGCASDTVVNISSGGDDFFKPIELASSDYETLRSTYSIERDFVLYTGGIDFRKNIEGLIAAYARLPIAVREQFQLVVVCSLRDGEKQALRSVGNQCGLSEQDLILTGYVLDGDLLRLYNACTLFVFPSLHEGFGLPVLEAMMCGKAVIASNRSSLVEVTGRDDALFDPADIDGFSGLMRRALEDSGFRLSLEQHAMQHAKKFTWANTAASALDALIGLQQKHQKSVKALGNNTNQYRLAYVSPLSPARTGISDYSSELLPALAEHYQIDVVSITDDVDDPWVRQVGRLRSVEWFRQHRDQYDRVLYQFGNSAFHGYMFDLLSEIPGVVVLHDFYLSGVLSYLESHEQPLHSGSFLKALFHSHGYPALLDWWNVRDLVSVVRRYPCNFGVLQGALGTIVHDEYPFELAREWYGETATTNWYRIPHLRGATEMTGRVEARNRLGLPEGAFVVCCFGILAETKLNDRLLDAWLDSALARSEKVFLVFVGSCAGETYAQQLASHINASPARDRIQITGWVSDETFHDWLSAADMAVQLRARSLGETSGAVLHCLRAGLPTIVNAHGSFKNLESASVMMLDDAFTHDDLVRAMETLWQDPDLRSCLRGAALRAIREHHTPERCASLYQQALEASYRSPSNVVSSLVKKLAADCMSADDAKRQARALALNFPPPVRLRQIMLDVSGLVLQQRAQSETGFAPCLQQWLSDKPPPGWRVELVYYDTKLQEFRYARRLAASILGVMGACLRDEPVDGWDGDCLLLNVSGEAEPEALVPLESTGVHMLTARYEQDAVQIRPFPALHEHESIVLSAENWPTIGELLLQLSPVIDLDGQVSDCALMQ